MDPRLGLAHMIDVEKILDLFSLMRVPQAVITTQGYITLSNAAFSQLVGMSLHRKVHLEETTLPTILSGLLGVISKVIARREPMRLRATAFATNASLELVLWVYPLSEDSAHLVAHVDRTK